MKRVLLFLPLIIAAAIGVILFWGLGNDPTKLDSARIDDPLPLFSLPSLQNPERLLSQEDVKGKVSLLNVWATWCPSCRVEHPYLLKIAKQYGVPVIGLNYKDERESAKNWLVQLGNPYLFNIFDEKGKLGLDLGVYGAPETYIVDKKGIVRYRHVGVVDEQVWKSILEPRIKQYSKQG
ncbi:DsbE family thiol:disulfide interchange protein [Alkalimarinus alittae]|uniref:DsbE family thiol:disulfide interchange protein n=1 Tax=Alkalimarinus alittae TaxID=2961619 RepID=A0ABY6MYP0_9ALTE|nr:DsbE family thiol:disulfide interchange protein [Alkalimarinus alittae]UZE94920.1 DsbE family thiol:disulfide interchange protein [Alkalimarinus alittae]